MADIAPAAAVVVATRDRAALLPRLIRALDRQQARNVEIIVVDDGSADDTWEVLGRLRDTTSLALHSVRLRHSGGPAAARNVGWRAARAPVVAFTDDDCAPRPEWLAALLDAVAGADIAQGRTVPDPTQAERHGPFSRSVDVSREDGYYQTCNIAYRRELLERLGGFDERFRFPAGEDTDLAWRAREAGARTTFVETAVVDHEVRPSSLRTALRDSWRWQAVALTARLHPQVRELFAGRYVWRESHRHVLTATAGLAVAAAGRGRATRLLGAALVAPYVEYRVTTAPLPGLGPRRRWLLLPAAFAVDAAEVAACLVGSARHRTLVL